MLLRAAKDDIEHYPGTARECESRVGQVKFMTPDVEWRSPIMIGCYQTLA